MLIIILIFHVSMVLPPLVIHDHLGNPILCMNRVAERLHTDKSSSSGIASILSSHPLALTSEVNALILASISDWSTGWYDTYQYCCSGIE